MRKGETEEIVLAVLTECVNERSPINLESESARVQLAKRIGYVIDEHIQGLVEDIIIPSK